MNLCYSPSIGFRVIFLCRLLYHLDAFIKAVPGELGPYIGELFCEIFKGGPSITLSLKEDQLWQMINLIFARGNESFTDTHAVLLDAFHELLIVKAPMKEWLGLSAILF